MTEPRGQEATRRLTFFVNSLLMDMPPPPPLDATVSLTTLTPFYSEDVLLSKADLLAKNSDGVTTLLYLQTLYKADWESFLERRQITETTAHARCFTKEHELETRLWASFRAQTLARTVEGMMHTEAALRLLYRLERVHGAHTARRRRASGRLEPKASATYAAACEASPSHPLIALDDLLKLKFGYVVSCQVYGKMKKNDDSKARDIDLLLRRFPLLRVAYIDEQRIGRSGAVAFYSCLVKASSDEKRDPVEVYRVRLPGNPVIGEGKPETQNHAIVFTRGETLQTIDMNQDGFFEEALKMRNLLQEFRPGAPGVDAPPGSPPTTIVGFREHIFTGSVSSLANYMALQELSFVTLGQRVLADPLRMRLHYGHPDVFDKLWFSTRGGVSKASKGINLSEDIFAGYTALIRGGGVAMKEYAQVGKGRDVGMQQIYKFEAKLSQGNAEQCLARDVSRVAARLDFPRLLSYYFGGIGHYINSALTIVTIQVATYLALLLSVYGAESIGHRLVVPLGGVQILLAGLGLLNTLPLLATLAVERGLWPAARDVAQVFASGGPLYFIFHIQTRAHYFMQTLLAGGATYRATGRGFVTRHSTFDEQYRFFAASHLYLGVELAAALVLMGLHTEAGQYLGRTWSLWLAVSAFLLAPFWFNPLGFSWPHVADDFTRWSRWIAPSTSGGSAADSWDVWYKEESAPTKRLSPRSKLLLSLKALLYVGLAKGLADFTGHAAYKRLMSFAHCALALVLLALAGYVADAIAFRLHYACHRLLKMVLGVTSVAVVAVDLGAGNTRDVGQLQTAPISVVFHSFRLSCRRGSISRSDLEGERLPLERARAEHPRGSDVESPFPRPGRARDEAVDAQVRHLPLLPRRRRRRPRLPLRRTRARVLQLAPPPEPLPRRRPRRRPLPLADARRLHRLRLLRHLPPSERHPHLRRRPDLAPLPQRPLRGRRRRRHPQAGAPEPGGRRKGPRRRDPRSPPPGRDPASRHRQAPRPQRRHEPPRRRERRRQRPPPTANELRRRRRRAQRRPERRRRRRPGQLRDRRFRRRQPD